MAVSASVARPITPLPSANTEITSHLIWLSDLEINRGYFRITEGENGLNGRPGQTLSSQTSAYPNR